MKTLIAFGIIGMFAIGCGGKKQPETMKTGDGSSGSAATETPGGGTPCAQEIALVCPDGQIDGCLKTPQEGTTHACVAK